MARTYGKSGRGAGTARIAAGSLNCACAKYGAAMIGCTHGTARVTSSESERASLSAASIAVVASPAICAEASRKWMLCG